MNRTSSEHQVVWNRPVDDRRCCSAAELHDAARADWHTPPFLASASAAWALSVGGGTAGAPYARPVEYAPEHYECTAACHSYGTGYLTVA